MKENDWSLRVGTKKRFEHFDVGKNRQHLRGCRDNKTFGGDFTEFQKVKRRETVVNVGKILRKCKKDFIPFVSEYPAG